MGTSTPRAYLERERDREWRERVCGREREFSTPAADLEREKERGIYRTDSGMGGS